MQSFKKLKILKKLNKIALIAHILPDADALCSMVVFKQFLQQKFKVKDVDIFAESNKLSPEFLEILESNKLNPPKQNYDAVIIMDCPNIDRTGVYKPIYTNAKIKINIDHHATNNFTDCLRYFDQLSSTCEIVYQICKFYKFKLNKNLLSKIYVGILTDTAGFSVGSISSTTLKIVGECIDHINYQKLYAHFYNSNNLLNQKLYAQAINNILTKPNNKFLITYISKEELKKLKATEEDVFGISNQLNTISSAKLVCFISPRNKAYYVSLRSKLGYDVSVIAKKFGGGGHIGAAAYVSTKSIKEIAKEIEHEFALQIKNIPITNTKIFD